MKKKISQSEIIGALEDKGLHKTAENFKKIVEELEGKEQAVGQGFGDENAIGAIESIIEGLSGDESDVQGSREEAEIEIEELGNKQALRQFYKADRHLDVAIKEFQRLRKFLLKSRK
jgi:hypothetical protein